MFDPNPQFPNIPDPAQHTIDIHQQQMMHQQPYIDPTPPSYTLSEYSAMPQYHQAVSHQSTQAPPAQIPMPPHAYQVPPSMYQQGPLNPYKPPIFPLVMSFVGMMMILVSITIFVLFAISSIHDYNTAFQGKEILQDILGYSCMGGVVLCVIALVRRFKNPKLMPVAHPILTTIFSFIGIGITMIVGMIMVLLFLGFLALLFDFALQWQR